MQRPKPIPRTSTACTSRALFWRKRSDSTGSMLRKPSWRSQTAEYLHEVARCILVEQYIGQRFPDRTSTKMLQVATKYLIGDHKYVFLQYYRILRCEEEMKHLFSLLRSNHQTLHLVLDEIRTNLDKAFSCKQTALYAQHDPREILDESPCNRRMRHIVRRVCQGSPQWKFLARHFSLCLSRSVGGPYGYAAA